MFWERIKAARVQLANDGKRLDNYWRVQSPDHYWFFGADSFPRVLEWVKERKLEDDQLVALSLAFRIYAETEEPAESLDRLRAAVKGDAVLVARLDKLLFPVISKEDREQQRKRVDRKQKHEQQRRDKSKTGRIGSRA